MFPLTNAGILAPLIVGFALEQVALDSIASHFRAIVTSFHKQGMSEAEIAGKLLTLMRSKEIKVTALKSTEVYTEPAGAADAVSTWLEANNTPSARNKLLGVCRFIFLLDILANGRFQIQSTARVPEAFIPPSDPWPESWIPITLINLADFVIQYSYPENGIEKTGILMENQISEQPTMFIVNTTYMFNLRSGRRTVPTS